MKNYYHVKTQEAYDNLMAFLEVLGCKWSGDDKPTEVDIFYVYEEKTVIEVDENKEMTFGSTPFYESVLKVTQLVEWTPELAKSAHFCITSAIRGIVDSVCSLLDILEKNSKVLEVAMKEETTKKEPMYEIPLPYAINATGKQQYLSYNTEKNRFVCTAKSDKLKQRFTETELKEKVPGFYRELAVKVDE